MKKVVVAFFIESPEMHYKCQNTSI